MSANDSLLAKISNFVLINKIELLKSAGLLKVPDKLIKETEEFIVQCYCWRFAALLEPRVSGFNRRKENATKIELLMEKWRPVEEVLPDVIYDSGARFQDALDSLVTALGPSGWQRLPKFFPDNIDMTTGFKGVFSPGSSAMSLLLNKNDDGSYFYDLMIDFVIDEKEAPVNIKRSARKESISPEELMPILRKDAQYISQVLAHFFEFARTYDFASESHLKNTITMFGHAKKLSAGIEPYFVGEGKRFTISDIDLPYTKGKNNFAKIDVHLVDPSKASLIDQQDWVGLWTPFTNANMATNTEHWIGNVYVKADPTAEIDSIASISGLNERLTELKVTARHEVQHFVQSFINFVTGNLGGLPSKKIRDPRFNPHGTPLGEKGEAAQSEVAGFADPRDPHGRVRHPLRDIEFYTRLSDSVAEFNQAKTYLPVSLHRDFMLAWVGHITPQQMESKAFQVIKDLTYREKNVPAGTFSESNADLLVRSRMNSTVYRAIRKVPNETFQWLKGYQPAKYRKAVSEFSKAVGL